MPYSYLIVDDERLSRDYIHDLILEFDSDSIVKEASSVRMAIPVLEEMKPDFLLLDIQMPGEEGFDLLELVNYTDFDLIVITAYSEYAIKAFKQGARDYLLKPIKKSEFKKSLVKAITRREKELTLRDLPVENNLENLLNGKLILNHQLGVKIITLRDIIYLEADNTYTTLITSLGEKIVSSKPINYFEKKLTPEWFFRIHKSHIINLYHSKEYSAINGNRVEMSNGISLHISRYRLVEFMQRIKNLT